MWKIERWVRLLVEIRSWERTWRKRRRRGRKRQIETFGERNVLLLRKRWEREEKQEELKLGCALQVKV